MWASSANAETVIVCLIIEAPDGEFGEVPGDLSAPYIKHNLSTNLISFTFNRRDCRPDGLHSCLHSTIYI